MKNITKKQFIDTVAQRSGKTKGTCARIVDEMLGTIADLVAQDIKSRSWDSVRLKRST